MTALDLVFVLLSLAGGAAVFVSLWRVPEERRGRAGVLLHLAAMAAGVSLACLGTALLIPSGVLAGAFLFGAGWAGWLRGGRKGRFAFLAGVLVGVLFWPGIRDGRSFSISKNSDDAQVAEALVRRLKARESRFPVVLGMSGLDVVTAMEAGRGLGDGEEDLLLWLRGGDDGWTSTEEETVRRALAVSGLPVLGGGAGDKPRVFLIPGALRILFLGDATDLVALNALAPDLASAPLLVVDERDRESVEEKGWPAFAEKAGVDLVIEVGRRSSGSEWEGVDRVRAPTKDGPWALRIELDDRGGFRTREEQWAGTDVVIPWEETPLLAERVVASRGDLASFVRLLTGLAAGGALFWGAVIALLPFVRRTGRRGEPTTGP